MSAHKKSSHAGDHPARELLRMLKNWAAYFRDLMLFMILTTVGWFFFTFSSVAQ